MNKIYILTQIEFGEFNLNLFQVTHLGKIYILKPVFR